MLKSYLQSLQHFQTRNRYSLSLQRRGRESWCLFISNLALIVGEALHGHLVDVDYYSNRRGAGAELGWRRRAGRSAQQQRPHSSPVQQVVVSCPLCREAAAGPHRAAAPSSVGTAAR